MRYARKPFSIDAYQLPKEGGLKGPPPWLMEMVAAKRLYRDGAIIHLKLDQFHAGLKGGDWIARDDEGRVFAIAEEVFHRMYEPEADHG